FRAFSTTVFAALLGCGGGGTMELRANQPSIFYVDGVGVGRGGFVQAPVTGKKGSKLTIVAKEDGYRDKTEYVTAPFDERKIDFMFEVGDRTDGRDSWGRKVADV